jgi:hypothetical protein
MYQDLGPTTSSSEIGNARKGASFGALPPRISRRACAPHRVSFPVGRSSPAVPISVAVNGARVDIAQGRLRRLRQLGSAAQPLSETLQMPIALS